MGQTGYYIAIFALSNFAGALLLAALFDKVGRVRMIAGTYLVSGVLLAAAGVVLGDLDAVSLTVFGAVIFFFASAGASAAYLTARWRPAPSASLLPRHRHRRGRHRRTAAVRQAHRRRLREQGHHGDRDRVLPRRRPDDRRRPRRGGLGVKAENESLENIASPLTAEDETEGGRPSPQLA